MQGRVRVMDRGRRHELIGSVVQEYSCPPPPSVPPLLSVTLFAGENRGLLSVVCLQFCLFLYLLVHACTFSHPRGAGSHCVVNVGLLALLAAVVLLSFQVATIFVITISQVNGTDERGLVYCRGRYPVSMNTRTGEGIDYGIWRLKKR